MQTREAIDTPTFTGLWQDGERWHVKYQGFWVGTFNTQDAANRALELKIRRCQLKRLQYKLIHAIRLNSLRLETD